MWAAAGTGEGGRRGSGAEREAAGQRGAASNGARGGWLGFLELSVLDCGAFQLLAALDQVQTP